MSSKPGSQPREPNPCAAWDDGKKKKGCLGPGHQSGFSPQSQEESGQQMAAESARASLQGLCHRKGVHDLGSCKLRPGDLQAGFVRKRFHKGGYYVSILSLLGPRAAPLPPFPGSPAGAVQVSSFGAGPPLLLEPLMFAAVSTHQEWQLLSACGGEEGKEDRRSKRP